MRNTKIISREITHYKYVSSPIGKLLVAGNKNNVMLINFPSGSQARQPDNEWSFADGYFMDATQQLGEYFSGERKSFTFDTKIDGTEFQKKAWHALCEIPYGSTASYGEIASNIGRPGASRAVGSANHSNPLPIVVPCHRVIGSNKSLTGFGGGLDTKRWLLTHEANHSASFNNQKDLFK